MNAKEVSDAFHVWWRDEGTKMVPLPNEDWKLHVMRVAAIAWLSAAVKGVELDKVKAAPTGQHHVVTDGKTFRIKFPSGLIGSCEYTLEEARAAKIRLDLETTAEWQEVE
jgi:hypothetical protein